MKALSSFTLGVCGLMFVLGCGSKTKNPGGAPNNSDALPNTDIGHLHFSTPVSETLDPSVLDGLWQVVQASIPEVSDPTDPPDESPGVKPEVDITERFHFNTKLNKIQKSSSCDFRQGSIFRVGVEVAAQFKDGAMRILTDRFSETRNMTLYCSVKVNASGFMGYVLDPTVGTLTIHYPEGPMILTKISDN